MEEVRLLLHSASGYTHVLLSAFDMLRYANLRTADFVKVIPELATIDLRILSRIDVDGETCYI
jgi:hypothetical protein